MCTLYIQTHLEDYQFWGFERIVRGFGKHLQIFKLFWLGANHDGPSHAINTLLTLILSSKLTGA